MIATIPKKTKNTTMTKTANITFKVSPRSKDSGVLIESECLESDRLVIDLITVKSRQTLSDSYFKSIISDTK